MYNDDKTECMKNNEEICKSHQTLIPFPESHVFFVAAVVHFPLLFVAPDHFGAKVLKICSLYSTQMQFWYHFELSPLSAKACQTSFCWVGVYHPICSMYGICTN